jgi:hypothetical protein
MRPAVVFGRLELLMIYRGDQEFCGLSVVQAIFNYSDYFTERNVPGIVASYVSPTPHQMIALGEVVGVVENCLYD